MFALFAFSIEMAEKKFNDQLRVICDFLTESKLKTDYILGLYYDRAVSMACKRRESLWSGF